MEISLRALLYYHALWLLNIEVLYYKYITKLVMRVAVATTRSWGTLRTRFVQVVNVGVETYVFFYETTAQCLHSMWDAGIVKIWKCRTSYKLKLWKKPTIRERLLQVDKLTLDISIVSPVQIVVELHSRNLEVSTISTPSLLITTLAALEIHLMQRCRDLWVTNNVTVTDCYRIPHMDQLFSEFRGATMFSMCMRTAEIWLPL